MRRIILSIGLFTALAVMLGAPGTSSARTVRYVALGDSLSILYGYVHMYHADLESVLATDVQLTTLGVAGSTSGDLATSLESNPSVRAAVADADVVTWNIGINDLYNARLHFLGGTCGGADNQDCLRDAVAAFRINWDRIVAAVADLNGDATLRTMDVYYPSYAYDASNGHAAVLGTYWAQVNVHINATPTQTGIAVAQVHETFNGVTGTEDPYAKGYILTDLVHLTQTGNRVVADALGATGFLPAQADTDGDGLIDLVDNCATAANANQINTDRDLVDLSAYGKAYNDVTWPRSDDHGDACDLDADNDGLANATETALPGPACPAATAATSPLLRDSDGDGSLDGAECALGSDPSSSLSRPGAQANDADRDGLPAWLEAAAGTDPGDADSDDDAITDGLEVRAYHGDPLSADGDGDGCPDRYEIASVNGDRRVNMMDISQVAMALGPASAPNYVGPFDLNRDGSINAIDLSLVARHFGAVC